MASRLRTAIVKSGSRSHWSPLRKYHSGNWHYTAEKDVYFQVQGSCPADYGGVNIQPKPEYNWASSHLSETRDQGDQLIVGGLVEVAHPKFSIDSDREAILALVYEEETEQRTSIILRDVCKSGRWTGRLGCVVLAVGNRPHRLDRMLLKLCRWQC